MKKGATAYSLIIGIWVETVVEVEVMLLDVLSQVYFHPFKTNQEHKGLQDLFSVKTRNLLEFLDYQIGARSDDKCVLVPSFDFFRG